MVRAKVEEARTALLWLTGSLSSTPWWQVLTVLAVLIASIPALVAAARWLPITQLGPETASGLGVRSERVRWVIVGVAVLLTAATCAFVGPIGFIALCAPAIARPSSGTAPSAWRRAGRWAPSCCSSRTSSPSSPSRGCRCPSVS
jgi:iron complex transport system permease protein